MRCGTLVLVAALAAGGAAPGETTAEADGQWRISCDMWHRPRNQVDPGSAPASAH